MISCSDWPSNSEEFGEEGRRQIHLPEGNMAGEDVQDEDLLPH